MEETALILQRAAAHASARARSYQQVADRWRACMMQELAARHYARARYWFDMVVERQRMEAAKDGS